MSHETNNNGKVGKGWLLTLLVPAFGFVVWQFISYMNANLTQRVNADEQILSSQTADISQIKADVAFIKGLLQQRWNIKQ